MIVSLSSFFWSLKKWGPHKKSAVIPTQYLDVNTVNVM